MNRTVWFCSLIVVVLSTLIGYLFYLPLSDQVDQPDRVRLISASMKLVDLIGFCSDKLGLSPQWMVQRQSARLINYLKRKEENNELEIDDKSIDNVRVRIYRPLVPHPQKEILRPAIVYFHGGAFYMGSIDSHHPITRELSRRTGFIVVSVEYRLAPENPFPDGFNDCLTVAQYFLDENSARPFKIDSTRLIIAGDSAGGNLAAAVTTRLMRRSNDQRKPAAQLLIYPSLQFFDQMLPSSLSKRVQIFNFGRPGLVLELYLNKSISDDISTNNHTSLEQKRFFRRWVDWKHIPQEYRTLHREPMNDDREGNARLIEQSRLSLEPDVSPLLVDDQTLSKLPTTLIISVGHDRLRDQAFIYAGRLKENNVDIVHRHYERTFHGAVNFLDEPFRLEISHRIIDQIVQFIRDRFEQ